MNVARYSRIGLLLILFGFAGILLSQDPADAPATLEDQIKQGLQETFGTVAIMDVTRTNQQELRVKTGLAVISDEAYRRVLLEVCAILVTKEEADYQGIRILNGIEKQGFVFKAPGECGNLIGKDDKEGKQLIFANTEFCQGSC